MRWKRGRRISADIQDRRGSSGGLGGLPMGGAIGGGGALLVVAFLLVSNLLGGGGADIGSALDQIDGGSLPQAEGLPPEADPDRRLVEFMSFVLDDAQQTWARIFSDAGKRYEKAQLVLFTDSTGSACGGATSDIGPHYCPADNKVYLDLDFFRDLRTRFGAPGDFAQAYVLAHEVAHHVQNQLGISDEVRSAQSSDPETANDLSVRMELQADCFAGVWAYTTYERDILENGDLQEGLDAAAAVGDDRVQEQATGRVDRESWTHGSSEMRMRWFERGFESGDPNDCNTFAAETL